MKRIWFSLITWLFCYFSKHVDNKCLGFRIVFLNTNCYNAAVQHCTVVVKIYYIICIYNSQYNSLAVKIYYVNTRTHIHIYGYIFSSNTASQDTRNLVKGKSKDFDGTEYLYAKLGKRPAEKTSPSVI